MAASIGVGDRLELLREPTNPYDELAILVRKAGVKVGYVPRRTTLCWLGCWMPGKQLFVMVESKQQHGAWHEIRIGIYLVE